MKENSQNLNLAREFVTRLENVCYNHTIIQVINALAQNTNYERRCYYGGTLALRQQTHLSSSAVKKALRKLSLDGLILRDVSQSDLWQRGLRQNYRLILPPAGLASCADWDKHARTPHHLDSFPDFTGKLIEYQIERERLNYFQEQKTPRIEKPISVMCGSEEDENFYW
jgi:hypothetical protein